jgi:hypothetical protein
VTTIPHYHQYQGEEPLFTITRRQVLQLKAVLRRAFGTRGPGPAVSFTAAAGMLNVKASSADIAVEYRTPHEQQAEETLWLPFQFLADCEGKKDEPVHIEATGKGRVTAQWCDGSVPQIVRYNAEPPADAAKFPAWPPTFAENPPRLLQALVDAGETCDPDSVRYALACLQLRGQPGSIEATDCRQLLVQSGFTFPWHDTVLIPRSKVFASAELPHDQSVSVGKTGNWVAIGVGRWVIYLAVNVDGRFPDVTRHIPQPADATARCQLSAANAEFLGQSLPRLPCDELYNFPITLDLNGSIAVRARAADQSKPTELVLSDSEWSGEPIRINTNRQYLARATKLGFRELCVFSNKTPVLCHDDYRRYVWALLDPETSIAPADDAICIESPKAEASRATSPTLQPKIERNAQPVSEPTTNQNGNGHAQPNGHASTNGHATKTNGQVRKSTPKAGQQDLAGLIQQAEILRTALRDSLVKTNELLKGLKRHRRQSRALQNTIASLRQLKGLGV